MLQEAAVAADTHDPAARRLLVDLLTFAGRLDDAIDCLSQIRTDEPEWPAIAQELQRLLQAECLRSVKTRMPRIFPQPPPKHATNRWRALEFINTGNPAAAVRAIDAADAVAPHLRGFLDGQEFEDLRDADDCFASILEALHDGEYVWFAWEGLRKVTLAPAAVLLDQLYRPATITLKDGTALAVRLPLVYPGSFVTADAFSLGTETDYICPDDGPTRCVGGKMLLVGDAEVPLSECRMIEIR
jgi:type VI secretion system protein ImpE